MIGVQPANGVVTFIRQGATPTPARHLKILRGIGCRTRPIASSIAD